MLKNLSQEEEFDSFLSANQNSKILVKFFTTWCPPCQVLQKNIEKLLAEKKELMVLEVNAEKFPSLAARKEFNVRSVPAIFLFSRGRLIKQSGGVMSVNQLREFVEI